MTRVVDAAQRVLARTLRLPVGSGVVLGPHARRRLAYAALGSALLAGLEVVAVASFVPLVGLLTGTTGGSVTDLLGRVLGTTNARTLTIWLAAIVIIVYVAKSAFGLALRWWVLGMMMRETVGVSQRIFDFYLRGPYALHLRAPLHEQLTTMGFAVGVVFTSVVAGTVSLLGELLTVLAIVVALLVVTPWATLALLGYFVVIVRLYLRWSVPKVRAAGQAVADAAEGDSGVSISALTNVKDVIVRGAHGFYLDKALHYKQVSTRSTRIVTFLGELPRHLLEIIFVIGIAALGLYAVSSPEPGSAVSTLALFGVAGFRILPSVVRALASFNSVRSGEGALVRVRDALIAAADLEPAPTSPPTPLPITRDVALKGVSFRYEQSEGDVVDGVSLVLRVGTSLALVGASGAGKTTIVDLVLGLHRPQTGRVLVDGVDIHDNLRGWRANIGIAPQQTLLVPGTVRENVAYTDDPSTVSDERVWAAIRDARLTEVVQRMPGGLDADVGPAGARLSGGERQRFGIARALYRDPSLLILDEATSALDNETEHQVTETLQAIQGRLTVLVVAHRLSTIRHCDQIAFLDSGRVVAVGTFEELRRTVPQFARLVELGSLG